MSAVRRRFTLIALLAALSLLLAACPAEEEVEAPPPDDEEELDVEEEPEEIAFPERDITWIVPFDPGGGSDNEVRRLQPHLEEILGVSINVEYDTGGGGAVGWTDLLAREPDGHTVAGIVQPHIVIQPLTREDAGYETDDFEIITWNRARMTLPG
jgi:hypothetical protein